MPYDNRPIGIFDSGLGGLTVAAALRRCLPDETLIYLGDTARVPYGGKSFDTIKRFAMDDARFLLAHEVKLVVVACNTVSAIAMDELVATFPDQRFIGVVEAGVAAALTVTPLTQLLVLGTSATIQSDSYRRLLHRQRPDLLVHGVACPLFVPLVEEGLVQGPLCDTIIRHYLGDFTGPQPCDALILGCTHYPLLKPSLRALLPERVTLVDSSEACAHAVAADLRARQATAAPGAAGISRFFVTDMPSTFFQLASRFLGGELPLVDKVTLV